MARCASMHSTKCQNQGRRKGGGNGKGNGKGNVISGSRWPGWHIHPRTHTRSGEEEERSPATRRPSSMAARVYSSPAVLVKVAAQRDREKYLLPRSRASKYNRGTGSSIIEAFHQSFPPKLSSKASLPTPADTPIAPIDQQYPANPLALDNINTNSSDARQYIGKLLEVLAAALFTLSFNALKLLQARPNRGRFDPRVGLFVPTLALSLSNVKEAPLKCLTHADLHPTTQPPNHPPQLCNVTNFTNQIVRRIFLTWSKLINGENL
jgi:hypothetical protein